LQECANDSAKLPPHSSSWALAISRPSTTVPDSTGNWSLTLTMPSSSAAVVVISLNVDPGG
jgi:hypothetical protein